MKIIKSINITAKIGARISIDPIINTIKIQISS